MAERYIWISRWEEFQHYRPERDRAPAWIKSYTKQLDDDRYLDLSSADRGLLSDLRAEFARARSRLLADRKRLSSRLGATVYQRQLDSLNRAGFIEFISRPTLEKRLEQLYSSPRARVEVEKEKESTSKAVPVPRPDEPPDVNGNGLRELITEELAKAKEGS